MNKTKFIAGIGVMLVSLNTYARDPYFVRYPQLNQNVANFTTAFINNIMPEIRESQVRFDFTEGTDGIKKTDMAYGQIQGTYQGVAQLPESTSFANIVVDFRINLEIAPKKEKLPAEYAINLRADGNINNTGNFMDFFMGTLTPECVEDNHVSDQNILGDICRAFVESKIDKSKSNVDNAYVVLQLWKSKFIDGLSQIKHSEIEAIKPEFIAYLNDRINISKQGQVLNLSINLENLSKDFDQKARKFLKETGLIDYSIRSVEVQMNESEIQFSAHVVKLHVINSINKYMELASSLTSVFENEKNGAEMGKAFRDGKGVSKGDILGHASISDAASAALTGTMLKIWGSSNTAPAEATQEEQDLGLD